MKSKLLLWITFVTCTTAFSQILPARMNSSWGFIDHTGAWLIPPIYREVEPPVLGLAKVVDKKGKIGFVNSQGQLIIKPKYFEIKRYDNGLIATMDTNRLWGVIDTNGAIISQNKFNIMRPYCNRMAAVQTTKGLWGAIDESGAIKVPCKYNFISEINIYGKAIVVNRSRTYVIDSTNRILMSFSFKYNGGLNDEGHFFIEQGNKRLITDKGKIINLRSPIWIESESEKMICSYDSVIGIVREEKKRHYVAYYDMNGFFLKEKNFSNYEECIENLCWGDTGIYRTFDSINQKYGFKSRNGELIIPYELDFAGFFYLGYSTIMKDGKWNFINPSGNIVFKYSITDILWNEYSTCCLKTDSGFILYNKLTKKISQQHFKTINPKMRNQQWYLHIENGMAQIIDLNDLKTKGNLEGITSITQENNGPFSNGFCVFGNYIGLVIKNKIVYYDFSGTKLFEED